MERRKAGTRYEVDLTPACFKGDVASGITVTITRLGIEVFGWYDHYVGIADGQLIRWADIDEARRMLVNPRKGADEK